MTRLNLGCGGKHHEGYINIDIRPGAGDFVWDCSKPLPFEDESIEEILCEAFFEHLFRTEAYECLKDWYKKLKPNGVLKILWLPDFDRVIECYQNGTFNNLIKDCTSLDLAYGCIMGAPCGPDIEQLHKNMYTKVSIEKWLKEVGFKKVDVSYCCEKIVTNPWPNDKYGLYCEAHK